MSIGIIAALAFEGERLAKAAAAIGGRVAFDPVAALARDLPLGPAGTWSPNRHCKLVEAADGWIAVNLAREDDRLAVPAWLECDEGDDCWEMVDRIAPTCSVGALIERAQLLGLPVAALGEAKPARPSLNLPRVAHRTSRALRALDLSTLWAGPYCGGLLAEAGIDVTKLDNPARPDPVALATPALDARLNGRKRRATAAFDWQTLRPMIANTDIIITSARPAALARLGLEPVAVFALNPDLIWVAVTAHGWRGENGLRVGFGDDCAAAGGLVGWQDSSPAFLGDALADPLTGAAAASAAMEAIAAGQCGIIDAAMASCAAYFAQAAGIT